MTFIKIALAALFIVLVLRLIVYAAKNQRIPVLKDDEKTFIVRNPPVLTLCSIVYFIVVGAFVLYFIIWQNAEIYTVVLLCALVFIGVLFLLYSIVFKIKVNEESFVYVGMFGIKKQIYYKDVKEAIVTKYGVTLVTSLKKMRFAAYVIYREDLLRTLSENHVKITRIND